MKNTNFLLTISFTLISFSGLGQVAEPVKQVIPEPSIGLSITEMLVIAREELEHLQMVHDVIKKRGLTLGRERKDHYVNELFKFMKKDGSRRDALCDRLLFSAMIEARSCERFKVLSENIKDEELSKFYWDLMESEASHYTTFITYARKYGTGIDVEKRWREWLEFEESIITNYGKGETIHG